jgi:hypothetical protein
MTGDRQIWQNLLRAANDQRGLFADDDDDLVTVNDYVMIASLSPDGAYSTSA